MSNRVFWAATISAIVFMITVIGYSQHNKQAMRPECAAKGGEVVTIGRSEHVCVKRL